MPPAPAFLLPAPQVLSPGYHQLVIHYLQIGGAASMSVKWGESTATGGLPTVGGWGGGGWGGEGGRGEGVGVVLSWAYE